MMYVKTGGKLGRFCGCTKSDREFFKKDFSIEIQKYLEKRLTVQDAKTKIVGCSHNTEVKMVARFTVLT